MARHTRDYQCVGTTQTQDCEMKVLIVKKKDSCFPFVEEQADALTQLGIEVAWHLISGKGVRAYIRDIPSLCKEIISEKPNIVHAHYGISGYYTSLLIRLMRPFFRCPVVITYHGSDINDSSIRKISQKAINRADYNIFVSSMLAQQVQHSSNAQVIPCGINIEEWQLLEKNEARKTMGLEEQKKIILFCSDYKTPIKNPSLAIESVQQLCKLANEDVQLIEMKGYSRKQVNILLCAADVCLMTSLSEGSPQIIKEAMACGCPIVTTRVGDVECVIDKAKGCYYTGYSIDECARQLQKALNFANTYNRTNGRKRIEALGYTNDIVAGKIESIYQELTNTQD